MNPENAYDPEAVRLATKKAMDYLARREHSCTELQRKLATAGFEDDVVRQAIDSLRQQRLQSDRRFTEAYIRYRAGRGNGPMRIRLELGEKGVKGALIDELMAAGEQDWIRLASEVRIKKFGDELPKEFKERARQARFLQYRGFSSDQIQSVLGGDD